MEFLILGPVEVRENGEARPVAGAKPRATLAALLLQRNEIVSTDRLIDALWGDRAPETAANALQVHVSQVRKAVAERLETRAPGYVLLVEPDELDLDRFERIAREARSLLAGGDAAAAATFREALSLWRGPALGGIDPESPLAPEAARLEDLRLAALEDRIDADLAAGGHGQLAGELEGLVAEHPFRERFRGQLMLALYRSGRQAAALEAYRAARKTFVEQLGIEPSPALQRLEQSILRQEDELDAPERVATGPVDLPTPPTPLLGRTQLVSELVALVSDPNVRLVTLTGPGGIGKTRLALAAAAEAAPALGGAAFVPLGSITDAELVPSTIAAVLGAAERPGESTLEALAAQLRGRRLLLVLDNFEQLLPAAPMLAELLASAPRLKAIVTSRAVLRISGEHELVVPPLPVPQAIELFVQRAAAAGLESALTPEIAGAVAELCVRLEGMPLAVELAAARSKLLPPPAMLARLGRRLDLPGAGARDAPARQQTLRATIDWSYELLDDDDQRLFALLGVFVGGCTLDSAEAVAGDDVEVLSALASLVDKSLVNRSGTAAGRFSMLETVREYSLERLDASGDAELVRRRHAEHLADIVERAERELTGAHQHEWLDRLEAEHDNIRTALAWALASGAGELALRLAAPMTRFWQLRGHFTEGVQWLEAATTFAADGVLRAKALMGTAVLLFRLAEYERTRIVIEESLALYRAAGDRAGTASALIPLGNTYLEMRDFEGARLALEEHRSTAQELGDMRGVCVGSANLAFMYVASGDSGRALPLAQESVALSREVADPAQLAISLLTLALAQRASGLREDALVAAGESLTIACRLRFHEELVYGLNGIATVLADIGEGERPARLIGCADALCETVSMRLEDYEAGERVATLDRLRERLGDEALERALAEGRALDPDAGVEEALAG